MQQECSQNTNKHTSITRAQNNMQTKINAQNGYPQIKRQNVLPCFVGWLWMHTFTQQTNWPTKPSNKSKTTNKSIQKMIVFVSHFLFLSLSLSCFLQVGLWFQLIPIVMLWLFLRAITLLLLLVLLWLLLWSTHFLDSQIRYSGKFILSFQIHSQLLLFTGVMR